MSMWSDTLKPKGKYEQRRIAAITAFWAAVIYAFIPAFMNILILSIDTFPLSYSSVVITPLEYIFAVIFKITSLFMLAYLLV